MKYSRLIRTLAAASVAALAVPPSAHAYIGPGAGFAFLGSTFVFILTFFLAVLTISFWPIQWAWRKLRGKGISKKARTRRVVLLGLDGLEPSLVERFIQEGKLPNLKALRDEGDFKRLGTTLPALSPVAWSTFQTGVNPGAHNIFDFLTRDKRHCLPLLSSTETEASGRVLKIGPLKLTLSRPRINLLRKSEPFWRILGRHGVFSNILRVPISYPPEKFSGNILSAMCTPDLRGTQGTFSFFTSDASTSNGVTKDGDGTTGGEVQPLTFERGVLRGALLGPPDPKGGGLLSVAFTLTPKEDGESAELRIGKEREVLRVNQFSRWISLEFRFGRRGRIHGICRFCLRSLTPQVTLYASPVNADPEYPALPLSSPIFFSTWLAKRQGPFGTLGLLEDTWGRNEHALDDQRFLDQAWMVHEERERMFLDVLDRTREGVCACVFDASDRIQHMFWRYLDDQHPSPRESDSFKDVIPEMYRRMDELVGKVRAKVKPEDVLVVLSDHGFASFRRCINLNTWLYERGLLAVKESGVSGADYFADVDWSRTKAFAVGLSGLYLNRKGRERNGIVDDSEVAGLKEEICRGLQETRDPKDGATAIRKVYDTAKEYRGLYAEEAPDLIVGYTPGYRVSWESVTGGIEPAVFSDNTKAWSGDHHVDPELIPGIVFSNRKINSEKPHIADIAPTVLDLFAVPVPRYMEGKVLL